MPQEHRRVLRLHGLVVQLAVVAIIAVDESNLGVFLASLLREPGPVVSRLRHRFCSAVVAKAIAATLSIFTARAVLLQHLILHDDIVLVHRLGHELLASQTLGSPMHLVGLNLLLIDRRGLYHLRDRLITSGGC